ncbi:MAG: hypothetical protein IPI35_14240 [Deltaproteobacteria bacterium]|nr:hypothetical protein [Deltaproteobacteria bacterium]
MKAAEGFGAVGDGPRQAFALLDLAENQTQQGQLVEAEQTLQRSLALAAPFPDPDGGGRPRDDGAVADSTRPTGRGRGAVGPLCGSCTVEPEGARAFAARLPRRADRRPGRSPGGLPLSPARGGLGRSVAEPRWQALTQVRLGRAALQRNKKAEAEAALRWALDSGELLGEPELRLEAMDLLAGILEARGETEEAAALREEESALRAWIERE